MNILFLTLNIIGKGTYLRAFHLARALAQRGHNVTLVATARQGRLHVTVKTVDGVTVVAMPDLFTGSLRSGWDIWNVLRRIAWLNGRDYDLVHAFETRPTVLLPALYEKRRRQRPLVFDWADWFGRGGSVEERPNSLVRTMLRPVETFFEERFRLEAERTTVICTELQRKSQALGVPISTIRHIPNGCNTDRFFPMAGEAARRALNLDVAGVVIGYCGSIFPRDARLMAVAFDQLHRWQPDVTLLVIGYCPVDICSLVTCTNAVIQTGYVQDQDMNNYLNACDICWLPLCDTNANRGRWPMKMNDYMAVGRPTVATAVGDVTELLRREAIGLLAPDDPNSFAQQTLRLIEDADLRAAMGVHAHKLALSQYSWSNLAAQLETLYMEIA